MGRPSLGSSPAGFQNHPTYHLAQSSHHLPIRLCILTQHSAGPL